MFFYVIVCMQEENMELKKQKIESCGNYSWVDYMSLSFTQNVSLKCFKEDI